MELSKLVLNELRCNQCKAYLSCAPVYLETNRSVCGRCCTSPKKNTIRNEPYEKLAHLIKFPCKYDDDGCSEILLFSNIKAHEIVCSFRHYKCTVQPDQCVWHGAPNDFYEHCQTMHEDNFVQNPYVLTHITNDIMKTVLVVASNMLFMIQMKVCQATKTLEHFVCLIQDPGLSSVYKYDLSIENNAVDRLVKAGELKQNIQKNIADVIDLNLILSENIRDITVTFLVSSKMPELITSSVRCKLCCDRHDIPMKLKKHEIYFCNNTSTCQLCNGTDTGDLYSMHYMAAHHSQTYKNDLMFRITANNSWNWCIIQANFGNTLCEYKLDANGFTIFVYTPLLSNLLHLYNCEILIKHTTEADQLYRLAKQMYECTQDWYLHVPIEEICSFIVNNKVDIQISFVESED